MSGTLGSAGASTADRLAEKAGDAPPACEAFDFIRLAPCADESVITLLAGCVHEHIVKRSVCQFHVEALANGRIRCVACGAVDGHRCEMSLIGEVAHA